MKVLFAVNNEKISESVIKAYQAKNKEIISAKNVYYFNAIIKELQKDKSYDRIVISEDLEPFSNRSYDMMDKFIFDKLDNISDEASNSVEGEIPIILICTDRREKSDPMLAKLFSIGIYSALVGKDRTVENLCKIISTPRSKKEAKTYYRVDSDDAEYKSENAEDIPENEMKNIINHYKRLGKNEDKYVESFNNIALQYSNEQLKIIANILPLNVRAVLEERCPKYQSVMMESVKGKVKENVQKGIVTKNIKPKDNSKKIDLIEKQLNKNVLTKPVVIPSSVDMSKVKKVYSVPITENEDKLDIKEDIDKKRGRGRPPKITTTNNMENVKEVVEQPKRGRGRPSKKIIDENEIGNNTIVNKKHDIQNILPKIEEDNTSNMLPGFDEENTSNMLPGIEEDNTQNMLPGFDDGNNSDNEENTVLQGFDTVDYDEVEQNSNYKFMGNGTNQINTINPQIQNYEKNNNMNLSGFGSNRESIPQNNKDVYNEKNESIIRSRNIDDTPNNLPNLLTADKKIVAFVGTSKNGTSFLVNNLAEMLSNKGINTAVLDLTKNKNAYYIYTQNDENLRNIAGNCIDKLRSGVAEGIQVHKNLTVYTTSPTDNVLFDDYSSILETLVSNYSLVLMDCDFETNFNYFKEMQELYIVQTYDILTIQPLTAFLRELKDRNILSQNKIRIVINKSLRVKELNERIIIGGISSYNDPTMSYMKELFDRNTVIYTTIPFEDQTYSKYLEGLVNCEISLKGYSKGLLDSLSKLGNMVYPVINNNNKYNGQPNVVKNNYNDYSTRNNNQQFGGNIEDTLSKMRKTY